MNQPNLIKEKYFHGNARDWLCQLPEEIVDKVISDLSLDPQKLMIPVSDNLPQNMLQPYTLKWHLWGDLVGVIHMSGMPTPSSLGMSPKNISSHILEIRKILSRSLQILKNLEYGSLFEQGTMTKEFIVADQIRHTSENARAKKEKRPGSFVSALVIKQEYDKNGAWGRYCPFDDELETTIRNIGKILTYVESTHDDAQKKIGARGTKKKGKDNYDNLLYDLCYIYKKYTGKPPTSSNTGTSAINAGQVTGAIIPFLQTILPYTYYSYGQSAVALQKKIERIRKNKKFTNIWTDSKK